MNAIARFVVTLVAVALLGAITLVAYKAAKPGQQRVELLDPAKVIILRTPGGMLEVATLKKVEEFGWQARYECPLIDCSSILQPTISRVRVPVHYVYRVPLAETWELQLNGDHYELTVPALQPASPVAFDTGKLEVESQRGWLSPTQASNERSLMRQLGPELDRRAGQDAYLRAVQPHAAQTVQEFARKWMKEQGRAEKLPVRVQFRYSP
ncbi:hypothetical protein [Ramlibacter albus]|uniref:DUF4230 domain-containing protein n=1 Tax=Ramlibacter albus TaxID=2079448 RepID=A0A923S2T5_9BURK|nr:hypothetical protein [Ramlibacter albus]MBC5765113.1 hypothetical protein [Ramlibacter albus]